MNFYMVDRIEELAPPGRIVTTKCLSSAEEYLADHFPAFPVMPGVLMLEACAQASAWLVRLITEWSASVVVLRRARNVRYSAFVTPGDTLRVVCELVKRQDADFIFQCSGSVAEATAVQARITLSAGRLADTASELAAANAQIIDEMKKRFVLCGGAGLLGEGMLSGLMQVCYCSRDCGLRFSRICRHGLMQGRFGRS